MLASPVTAEAQPLSEIERAVYELCPLVFSGSLRIDDRSGLAQYGYQPVGVDEEGEWAELRQAPPMLRIGRRDGRPGCMVRYSGTESDARYEEFLEKTVVGGYVFADGRR